MQISLIICLLYSHGLHSGCPVARALCVLSRNREDESRITSDVFGGQQTESGGAGAVACGLKVAAFIRWAFSEGTNDRGGRNGRKEGEGEGHAALRPSREPHLSGRRKRGRAWRTFRLTLSKSFSHPDNDLARARPSPFSQGAGRRHSTG